MQANIFQFDQKLFQSCYVVQMHSNSADEKYKEMNAKIKKWIMRIQKPQLSEMNMNLYKATGILHPFLPLIDIERSSIKNPFRKFNKSIRRVHAE